MFFFFNDTAPTDIYTYCHTLSLHDALPIFLAVIAQLQRQRLAGAIARLGQQRPGAGQSVGIGRRRIGGRNALVLADVAGHERPGPFALAVQDLPGYRPAVDRVRQRLPPLHTLQRRTSDAESLAEEM